MFLGLGKAITEYQFYITDCHQQIVISGRFQLDALGSYQIPNPFAKQMCTIYRMIDHKQ